MPSFRDLKGRPVEDVVDSRSMPGLPDPGVQMVEREAVRQAVEAVAARKPRTGAEIFERPAPLDLQEDRANPVQAEAREFVEAALKARPELVAPVAKDVEEALQHLEASMALIYEQCQQVMAGVVLMREQVIAVRHRAEKDAGRLAKVLDTLKQVGE